MGANLSRARILRLLLAVFSSAALSQPLYAQQLIPVPQRPVPAQQAPATPPAQPPVVQPVAPAPAPPAQPPTPQAHALPADQKCDLVPLPTKLIETAPTTTFLPNGKTGQILIKWVQPGIVRIFEVGDLDSKKWRTPPEPADTYVREATVTAIKPTPEKTFESQGFLNTNSNVIQFIVPDRVATFWKNRNFVVRVCGQGQKNESGWGLVRVPISSPLPVRIFSILFLLVLYAAFAYAIYKVRAAKDPVVEKWSEKSNKQPAAKEPPAKEPRAKYPAYDTVRDRAWVEYLNPVVLTAGPLNTGSIQKLQVLLFSLLVGGMVLSLVLTLGVLTDLSSSVVILLGISAGGAAMGQATTITKERLDFENWAWLVGKKILPIKRLADPKWSDLVMTGREFDVYKLQTLVFSVVVAVALVTAGEDKLAGFTVPDALLGILGLSQAAYLVGTLVRPPSVADLNKALSELRVLEEKLRMAVAYGVDTDQDGKLPEPLPPRPTTPPPSFEERARKGMNALTQYNKKADQVEIMLESALDIEVKRELLMPEIA